MESKTPRTDSESRLVNHTTYCKGSAFSAKIEVVDADVARRLETELADAHKYAVDLVTYMVKRHYPENKEFAPLPDVLGVLTQIDNAYTGVRNRLAEARAEIAKLETIAGEQRKAYFEQGHIMQAQANKLIESDKLIEQMREALLLFAEGASHDFHYVCQHRDNCLCLACQKARVKAALAAERGG